MNTASFQQQQLDASMESTSQDLQWPARVEDPFDNFVNPHSFDISSGDVETSHSNDQVLFCLPSTGETDNIDSLLISDTGGLPHEAQKSWQDPALSSFIAGDATFTSVNEAFPITHALDSGSIDTDLLSLDHALNAQISSMFPQLSSSLPTPGYTTGSNELDTSFTTSTRPQGSSSSRVKKQVRRESSSSGRMSLSQSGPLPRQQQQHGARERKLQDPTIIHQWTISSPLGQHYSVSPLSSTRLQSGRCHSYPYEDLEVPFHSDAAIPEESTENFPPLSNEFTQYQNSRNSPMFELTSRRSSLQDSQPGHQLSSYPSTPRTSNTDDTSFPMTPPQTHPMISHHWKRENADADALQHDKAEEWLYGPNDQSDATYNAPPTRNLPGLGISNMHSTNLGSRVVPLGEKFIPPSSITPTRGHMSYGQSSYSASASPDTPIQHQSYPVSPLDRHQAHAHMMHNQRMLQQQAQQMTYRTQHPMTTISPSAISSTQLSQSTYLPLPYLNDRSPSINTSSRTPSLSPSPVPKSRPQTHQKRGKSSAPHRRNNSNVSAGGNGGISPSAAGFINFTPHDSRRILTGVAPSGSSKTKARREREAAEKRRKLSEAAKRAILEAGGDVSSLEREGVLYS